MYFSRTVALTASALALFAASALAIDYPPVKPGLWESRVSNDGASPRPPSQMCVDPAVLKEMLDIGAGMMKSMCAKNEQRRDGNRIYGTSECTFDNSTIKSSSVTTFNGETSYRIEIKSTHEPPLMGKSASNTLVEARWVSPCPAGMQAGDVLLPGGQRMNIRGMMGGK